MATLIHLTALTTLMGLEIHTPEEALCRPVEINPSRLTLRCKVSAFMTEPTRSAGEALFEQYLNSQGLTDWEFEKEHPGKRKRPDYTVRINREYLFDVKEFQLQVLQSDVGYYEPYGDIRSKIEEGRRKFQEYKDWPCSLVLYNDGSAPLVHLKDPHVMFGAMRGDV